MYKKQTKTNRYAPHIAGTTLEELVDLDQAFDGTALDLTSEIEIARALCGNAAKMLGVIMDGMVKKTDGTWKDVSPKSLHQAVQYTQSTLHRVACLVEKQAKIRALSNGSFDENFLQMIISRVTTDLQKRLLPDNKELFETCCADMAEIAKTAGDESGNGPQVSINIS